MQSIGAPQSERERDWIEIRRGVSDREQPSAKTVDGCREVEITVHLQRGEADIPAIKNGDTITNADQGKKAPAYSPKGCSTNCLYRLERRGNIGRLSIVGHKTSFPIAGRSPSVEHARNGYRRTTSPRSASHRQPAGVKGITMMKSPSLSFIPLTPARRTRAVSVCRGIGKRGARRASISLYP